MRGGGFDEYSCFKFAQPKSEPFCNRCIAHRIYTLIWEGYFNMYILHYFRTIFSFNFVCVLSWLKYSAGLVSFIEHPVIYIGMRIRNNIYSMPIDVSISTEFVFSKILLYSNDDTVP